MYISTYEFEIAMLESTEPLAVVEIRDIFWDHRLQWTRCDIIDSRKNRAPFDSLSCQEEEEDEEEDEEEEEHLSVAGQEDTEQYQNGVVELVDYRRSPSQLLGYRTLHRNDTIQDNSFEAQQNDSASISDESQDAERVRASLDADDSISGLHHRMDKMIVLESAQGSLYSGAPPVTEMHMLQDQSFLRQIQEDGEERWQPDLYLQSSQGSIDGENEADYDRHRGALQPVAQRNSTSVDCDLTSELGEPTRDDTTRVPVDLDDTRDLKVVSIRTNTCISSISEIVSATTEDLTNLNPVDSDGSLEFIKSPIRAPSPEVVEHLPSEMTKDRKDAHRQSVNIIFSNLFSWTDLKIKDRVEIHEPCRKIAFSKGRGFVLIVERYQVLTLH
ncbi:hypothetical protein BGZ93_009522 [Podila epicladia]|nr:hypothetical protein BGZ92_001781 [Podila epicladia]KAG0099020.1 hypothetical protein BGZ93_009522 [Podila epicladia]